jgi:hypothetical protein
VVANVEELLNVPGPLVALGVLLNSPGPVTGFGVLLNSPGTLAGLGVLLNTPGPLAGCFVGFAVGGAIVDTAFGVVDISALPGAVGTDTELQFCHCKTFPTQCEPINLRYIISVILQIEGRVLNIVYVH